MTASVRNKLRRPRRDVGPSPLGDSVTDDIKAAMRDPEYRRARAKYAVAEEVARALIRFRGDHRLTQKAAARALGMTESMICRLERGDHVPSVETLLRVAEATGNVLTVAFTPAKLSGRGAGVRAQDAIPVGPERPAC